MSSANHNLSSYNPDSIPSGKDKIVALVVSEWNQEITFALRDGAMQTLINHGINADDIIIEYVPGSVELTFASRIIADRMDVDAVLALGCVVRGETPHFNYVCDSVTYGISELNLTYDLPFIFGVLTVENQQQALDRAGGKHGNKGIECAVAALKMMAFTEKYPE